VAYLASLDGVRFDSNGFVESGLVHAVPGWTDDIYDRLKIFYQAPGWRNVMRAYDAAYGADAASLVQTAAATVRRHLRPDADEAKAALPVRGALARAWSGR
jgi:hypothetical protein